uniref:Uncharacterized protein n=1 Tax=Ixodes scapularis TaxID=6945 RepID=A0A4D5RZH4_IXOSC
MRTHSQHGASLFRPTLLAFISASPLHTSMHSLHLENQVCTRMHSRHASLRRGTRADDWGFSAIRNENRKKGDCLLRNCVPRATKSDASWAIYSVKQAIDNLCFIFKFSFSLLPHTFLFYLFIYQYCRPNIGPRQEWGDTVSYLQIINTTVLNKKQS